MVLIKNINVGSESLTVNLGAEELFYPYDTDCPDNTDGDECDPNHPEYNPEGCATPSPPPIAETPSVGGSDWYSEDCDDCCHPITDEIINYMEVVVVAFTSSGYTDGIACSDADVESLVNSAVAAGAATVLTIDPKAHSAGTLSNTRIKTKSDGTQVYDLDYTIDIPIVGGLEHLEVVSYMRVDFDRLKLDKEIDVATSLQTATTDLMGISVSHETVIESGQTKQDSYVYIDPATGKVWDGPVHNHPSKGVMAGATHSKIPHPVLTVKKVPNTKVQNDNVKDEILNLDIGAAIMVDSLLVIDESYTSSSKDQLVKTFISEPIASRAPDGKTRFLFSIDHANLVKAQSRYTGLKDPSIYMKAPIENLQIYRQYSTDTYDLTELGVAKVGDASNENQSLEKELIVSTADLKSYNETPSMYASTTLDVASAGLKKNSRKIDKNFDGVEETKMGAIEEINVMNLTDRGLRVFSVEDSEISSFTSGKFGYSVELQFQDPSVSYLNKKLSELCAAKDSLADLSSDIINLRAYDSTSKNFKDGYRATHGSKHTSVVKESISQIIDINSVTTGQIDKTKVNYLMSLSSAQTGSPAGVETLVEIMGVYEEKLYTLLEGSLDIDNSANANIEKDVGVTNASNADLNLVSIEKTFDYLVDRNIPDNLGVDYFKAEIRSFPQLTVAEYSGTIETVTVASSNPNSVYITPMEVSVGEATTVLTGDTSVEEYQDLAILSAAATSDFTATPTAQASIVAVAEDIMSALGVTITLATTTNDDPEEIQTFSSDSNTIFGDNSFSTSDIDTDISLLSCGEASDGFTDGATTTIGAVLVTSAQVEGTLNPESPINQDQELLCATGQEGTLATESGVQMDSAALVEIQYTEAAVAEVQVLSSLQLTTDLGPSLVAEQYSPISQSILNNIPAGSAVLVSIKAESLGEGVSLEPYTENILITNGSNATIINTTNISSRSEQVTNYIDNAFLGAVFESPSQTTTMPIQSCR